MGDTQKHNVEWKNPGIDKYLLYDFIAIKYKSSSEINYTAKCQKSGDFAWGQDTDRKWASGGSRWGGVVFYFLTWVWLLW